MSQKSVYLITQQGQQELSNYNEKRKAKYQVKTILKSLDTDKSGLIGTDVFLHVVTEYDILLSDKDVAYLRSKANKQGKLVYEDVIKELTLIVNEQSSDEHNDNSHTRPKITYQWILRSCNHGLVNNIKSLNQQNLIRLKKKPRLFSAKLPLDTLSRTTHSMRASPKHRFSVHDMESINKHQYQNSSVQNTGRLMKELEQGVYSNNVSTFIQALGPEMQGVVSRIVTHKNLKKRQSITDWSKHMSAGSKKINLMKNTQNRIYIKSVLSSEKIQQQRERIRKYMKESEVDIMHLNAINGVFLDCDEEGQGYCTKKQLLLKIAEENLAFPAEFLFNLIQDLQADSSDMGEEAYLTYENLKNIIEIYNNLPIFLKGDSNNSDAFKGNMDLNQEMNPTYERIDRLLRQVHSRIEQKFKDFRHAFRSFDKDFGGSLDFKEFITGMEESGIKLKLSDYRIIFDHVDYDSKGEIGFNKFCLLNQDRKYEVQRLKAEHLQKQSGKGKKPPLPPLSVTGSQASQHPLFGENIPKNKDVNGFQREIQNFTPVQNYLQRKVVRSAQKVGYKTVADMPDDYAYGKRKDQVHDMVKLLTGSYNEELKRVTIEELRESLAKKRTPIPKYTQAQYLRDNATKMKYVSGYGRRNSASSALSTHSQKRPQTSKQLFLKGSNEFTMKSHNSSFHGGSTNPTL